MFYTRINKIKVFNNREGFLGYSIAPVGAGLAPALISVGTDTNGTDTNGTDANRAGARSTPTLSDLASLPDEAARRQKLLEAVLADSTGNLRIDYTLFGFEKEVI
jgi:hypothetical protein